MWRRDNNIDFLLGLAVDADEGFPLEPSVFTPTVVTDWVEVLFTVVWVVVTAGPLVTLGDRVVIPTGVVVPFVVSTGVPVPFVGLTGAGEVLLVTVSL